MDEEHTGHAARLGNVGNGNVIADNHHLDFFPKAAGPFCRKAEIKPVARVVWNDEKAAGFSGHGEDRRQNRIKARRGKHFAADRRRQHALADKAGVGRFMARSAAGNDRNLGRREIGAADNLDMRIAIERGNRGGPRGAAQAINGLGDNLLFDVDKQTHGQPLQRSRPNRIAMLIWAGQEMLIFTGQCVATRI